MSERKLVVPKKLMDEVGQQQLLEVPSSASQRGVGDDASYTWTEALVVTGTGVVQDKKYPGTYIVTVQTRVHEQSPQSENIGKPFTMYARVDFEALTAGDKSFGRWKMSEISLGKLKQLVKAAGETIEGDFDVDAWFESPKPLIGSIVLAKITHKITEDQNGELRPQQDVSRFVSE